MPKYYQNLEIMDNPCKLAKGHSTQGIEEYGN